MSLVFQEISLSDMQTSDNGNILSYIIYKNFIELSRVKYVEHTKKYIANLLSSEQLFGYLVKFNNKIIAYLVGENTQLQDGRYVYYISYMFVVPKYRKLKIGTALLQKVVQHCKNKGINFVVLTFDTNNKILYNFYHNFGFVPDPMLTNGMQHEIFCLYL